MAQERRGRGALEPGRALLYAAAVIGAIDFFYATIFVMLRGRPWYRPWQGVASSVLGTGSFSRGYASAALGIVLHFMVAAAIAGVYLLASRWIPLLWRQALLCGLAYGAIAFFVMNLVVIPLTRIGRQPLTWSAFNVGAIICHVLLIGPAAAYFARRATDP
jgi:hypothetical protein